MNDPQRKLAGAVLYQVDFINHGRKDMATDGAPTLFVAAQPRADVLAGTLTDAIFAASLDEVVAERAPKAYGDPATFFAATHPSAGLRSLLNEALGRVSGRKPDAAPVIRLETNLGGGKTHNLIALYHAARGQLDRATASEFMDPALALDQAVEL